MVACAAIKLQISAEMLPLLWPMSCRCVLASRGDAKQWKCAYPSIPYAFPSGNGSHMDDKAGNVCVPQNPFDWAKTCLGDTIRTRDLPLVLPVIAMLSS